MGKSKRRQWPPQVVAQKTCSHFGEHPIKVGPYKIWAGGTLHLQPGDLDPDKFDLLVTLTGSVPYLRFGVEYRVLGATLVDFGGVPPNWTKFLMHVIEELKAGTRILAFCAGSHGRTGCFLGSLIALVESTEETPDPIAAIRQRHCYHAVETLAQAEAIFAQRGEELPAKYREEFESRKPASVLLNVPQPVERR